MDRAMDEMFLYLDDRLSEPEGPNLAAIERVLAAIEPLTYDGTLLVGVLTMTAAVRDRLPSRPTFVEKVRARLREECSSEEEVRDTLRGLE